MPFSTASRHSKNNEDLKQQNSELEEKLLVLLTKKDSMQLEVEELRKKLEMSELLLQQVRGWSPREPGPPPAGAKVFRSHLGWPPARSWILVMVLPQNPPEIDKNLQIGALPRHMESESQG